MQNVERLSIALPADVARLASRGEGVGAGPGMPSRRTRIAFVDAAGVLVAPQRDSRCGPGLDAGRGSGDAGILVERIGRVGRGGGRQPRGEEAGIGDAERSALMVAIVGEGLAERGAVPGFRQRGDLTDAGEAERGGGDGDWGLPARAMRSEVEYHVPVTPSLTFGVNSSHVQSPDAYDVHRNFRKAVVSRSRTSA